MARRKSGCLVFFIAVGLLILIGGAGVYVYEEHQNTRELVESLAAELPAFDEDAAAIEAAGEMGLEFPVKPPVLDEGQIREKAREELEAVANESFPLTVLASQTNEIIERYRVAKEGETVTFTVNTTNQTVSGKYAGLSSDWKGRFVVVDGQRYRTHDIDTHSHYFFDSAISQRRATEEIALARKEFNEKRREIMLSNRDAVLDRIYGDSGYTRQGDVWKSNVQAHAELVGEKRRQHERDKEKSIENIYDDNRVLGIFRLARPDRPTAAEGQPRED